MRRTVRGSSVRSKEPGPRRATLACAPVPSGSSGVRRIERSAHMRRRNPSARVSACSQVQGRQDLNLQPPVLEGDSGASEA